MPRCLKTDSYVDIKSYMSYFKALYSAIILSRLVGHVFTGGDILE